MFKRIIAIMTAVSTVLLGILLLTTTPARTGPLGILAFFVFTYLSALGLLTFLFWGGNLLLERTHFRLGGKGGPKNASFRVSYYYASVAALVPVMLIAMQSVGEIGVYQILLILIFVVVAWIYVMNRTS